MTQKEALEILKMGHSAFITGAAGSGKTYLLNEYIKFLRQAGVSIGITASTGIAATHMGGVTIHSWSGLGIKDNLNRYELQDLLEKPYLKKRFDEVRVLIIDEVSMMHHFRLDLIDQICRAFKKNDESFGGLQVILCGDFFQLPPVSRYGEPPARFAYHSDIWENMGIRVCYLEEQHRQSDKKYLEILNAIRDNTVTADILGQLQSRFEKKTAHAEPTKLYSHNVNVDAENERELSKIPGDLLIYNMSHHGRRPLIEMLEKSCLAPVALRLKKGARVMFVKNNFEEGYVNGTVGIVEYCSEYKIRVKTNSGILIDVEPATWMIEEDGVAKASITQYPLRLAWAITVHKSQGMSLDAAVIDLSQSFEKGMGYVALSRVRSLAGLSLLGLNEMALKIDDEVMQYDKRFREQSAEHASWLKNQFPEDKDELKNDFLARVGGTAKPAKAKEKKASTISETKRLLKDGLSIKEIAKARGMAWGTVVSHLERLKKSKVGSDLSIVQREIERGRLEQIKKAILSTKKENGEYRLSPVRNILGDDFSFDEIRLARLLVD
ncbi:MAG: AAA family ATPase [Candidatus Buchananbacteria bacterium]|jgi:ATP-dependent exoDNAse (exonuclease V) alpha subunit/transposase